MSGFTDTLKVVAPWAISALGGPLAPVVASIVSSITGVAKENVTETLENLSLTSEGRLKLQEIETAAQIKLAELGYASLQSLEEIKFKAVAEVNATIRAETTAEKWPQYSWRPFNGFLFGITIFCTYFILPLCKIPAPEIPETVWGTWGLILGVASFFRGKMQADPAIPAATRITKTPLVVPAPLSGDAPGAQNVKPSIYTGE